MSWKAALRPSSFRGVGFHVTDREHSTGRRIHNHEYPKRDENFAEDMGRSTRKWSVSAYLVGDDYMARRDRLLAALEAQGAAQYVDRWGRSHQCVVDGEAQLKESEHDGRYCTISFKLIAAGSAPSANGLPAAVSQVIGAAQSLAGVSIASFADLYLPGQMMDLQRAKGLITSAGLDLGPLQALARDVDLEGRARDLVAALPLNQLGQLPIR